MLFRHQIKQNVPSNTQDMHPWQPNPQARILILAPHPDDETLAAGGLIASVTAMRSSPRIRVIVATNGDASYLTAITAGGLAFARRNFQHLAVMRQQESMSALTFLGLDARQSRFWGFPDRGLNAIWRRYWMPDNPYRSSTTGYHQSEQAVNSPVLSYTGTSLMRLFQKELSEFQPTTVILPHPEDAHPDHRSLAYFALLGVALYQKKSQGSSPELLAYRMWQGSKLWIKGARSISAAGLPDSEAASFQKWQYLPLSPEIQAQKALALQCYASQKLAAGQLLRDAAQNNYEIFNILQPYSFSTECPIIPLGQFKTKETGRVS